MVYMKRTTEILIAAVLLLAGTVLAEIKPIGYRCEAPLPQNNFTVECYVKQFEPGESAGEDYTVFQTWDEFALDFVSHMGSYDDDPNTWAFLIKFENDIDLGGYSKKKVACEEPFTPIDLVSIDNSNNSNKPFVVDGDDHTIKNFCYIAEGAHASFFGTLKAATIKNLNFENAYVVAKMDDPQTVLNAAVVVNEAENTSFDNVSVSKSKVYGWNSAAVAYAANGNSRFSDVRVDDVLLALNEESAGPQVWHFYDKVSYRGGVVANLYGQTNISNVSVSKLVVPDSVAQIMQRNNASYIGASYVGGIIGLASVSMDGSTSFSLEGCTVSAELTGSSVGGLIGSVSPHSITQESIFEVANADVTFKSGDYSGANQNRYLGGLVGALSWRNGSVQLLKNKVETTIKNTKTEGSVGSYLGGVVGVYTGLGGGQDAVADFTINENDVAVDISSSDTALAVGGIVGYATVNATNSTFAIRNSTVKPVNPGKNPNVITATASKMYRVHAAYVVGRVDNPNYTVELRGNHAEGNIKIAASTVKTMSGVGAMAGRAYCLNLYVRYNTSIGDLSVPIANETAGTDSDFFHVGYEVGEARVKIDTAWFYIDGNYHYGFSDVNAGLAVGWIGITNTEYVKPELWKIQTGGYYRIWNNYRNAVKTKSASLAADGSLEIDGSGAIYVEKEDAWIYDGVLDDAEMRTRLFTYVLNGGSSSGEECGENGSVCWENEPDSLPKASTYRTVYKVTIVLSDVYDKLTDADKKSVKKYLYESENGSYLTYYTDRYLMLEREHVKQVYGLSVVHGLFEENAAAGPDLSEGNDVDLYNFSTMHDAYLRAAEIPYENVHLDVNTTETEVFYGVDSEVPDSLVVPNGNRPVFLPSQIYTAEACVMGWAFNADTNDYKYHVNNPGSYLYPDINAEKTLYAVWMDAETCLGRYVRVRLGEFENGTIAVDEYRDGTKAYTHHFAKDSTMLLPWDNPEGVAMRLLAEPDSGYALDSLVIVNVMKDVDPQHMSNSINDGSVERYVLQEGDTLPDGLINATLTAYFSEAKDEKDPDKTPGDGDSTKVVEDTLRLVRHDFAQSGNAVRFIIETNKFKVDRAAQLKVVLMDAQGVVLDEYELAKKIKETPYRKTWTEYPLQSGSYVARVMLFDKKDTIPFDTAFTVGSEIVANGWQMLSLSDVAIDSIVWDDDPVFYRWDESAAFGEFWKYQKYVGGEADPQQGFWYSSLEDRPLLLRGDSLRSGKEVVWELDSGWNMVANPYGWDISVLQDTLDMSKWYADRAGYDSVSVLGPYEAVWLYSETGGTVRLDAAPQFDPLDVKHDAKAKLQNRENWSLQVSLSDTRGHRDSWNVLGVGTAKERLEPPMGMGDLVNLSIMSGKRALSKSVKSVKAQDEARYEWELAMSASSDRVGYLRFDGVKALNQMGLKVYVTLDGETAEAKAGDSLKVMLKASGSAATVRVTASDVHVVASKLGNLRFERVSGALQVGFDVDDALVGAGYQVQLVGVNGAVAASAQGKSAAGRNTLALKAPKQGLYLLRVSVAGHHASRKVAISR